jgi:flagellar capping protein FliD
MTRNITMSQRASITSVSNTDRATGAFDLASKRIGQQVAATNVQLSAFGQVKSSFVDVQSAGKNLSKLTTTSTTEDVTKAVQSFADAFNSASKAVNTAVKGDGKAAGALAGDAHANLAGIDLKRVVAGGNNAAELKKIGVNVNQDGTLAVDAKALQSALQANPNSVKDTLAKIGAQADKVSQKELAGTGNIGGAVNALSTRAKNLETRAADQQKLATDSQNTVQQQVASINNSAADGIAAYMQMFSI